VKPVTPGFHHVALVTQDLEPSLAFYRDVLGLIELGEPENGGRASSLFLGAPDGAPGSQVLLIEQGDVGPGRPGIGGVHHTAFGVPDEEVLLKWKRRLTDLGWAVSGPYDRGYFTSLYFRDPDGQILEIATAGPGYAIDEPVDRLGGELMIPPQRIVRGHRDEAAIAALTHAEPVPEITSEMTLQGIHHISGITEDLDQAGEFLESALGLKLIKKTTNRDDPQQLHFFWANTASGEIAPHSSYTLFGWPSSWNRARRGVGQTAYVAFQRGSHSLEEWAEHLMSVGVSVAAAPEGQRRRIRFTAPDGQGLEIVDQSSS
jgi:glyoxalase family protein